MPDVRLSLLERVRIASPCHARWEDMTGDEKVRRCHACTMSVHNFSVMPRTDVEALLARHFAPGGASARLCGTWYRRSDGTAILDDCPVGWALVRRRARIAFARVAALCGLTTLVGLVAGGAASPDGDPGAKARAAALAPFATIARWLNPAPPAAWSGPMVRGEISISAPPPPSNSPPPGP